MHNNDGLKLEYTSVISIINKLKMYIELEEKNITNIKNSFNAIDNYYSGNNTKIIASKKKDLFNALNTMLENRKKYVIYLSNMVNKYIELDMIESSSYSGKADTYEDEKQIKIDGIN